MYIKFWISKFLFPHSQVEYYIFKLIMAKKCHHTVPNANLLELPLLSSFTASKLKLAAHLHKTGVLAPTSVSFLQIKSYLYSIFKYICKEMKRGCSRKTRMKENNSVSVLLRWSTLSQGDFLQIFIQFYMHK